MNPKHVVPRLLAAAVGGAMLVACDGRVPLGSWAESSAGGGAAGAPASGGSANVVGGTTGDSDRLCGTDATPGPLNPAGTSSEIDVTLTYTDYTWPAAMDSFEWEIRVETEAPTDGYFWAHEFTFTGGGGGFLGLQARGGYQADPPIGPVVFANMIVFWIHSDPLQARLGDVAYPMARTAASVDVTEWLTIHVRYAWRPCETYALRLGQHSVEPSGTIWYGAWIREASSGTETFLGRILVPAAWGRIAAETSVFSNRIGYDQPASCDGHEHASAFFSLPTTQDGTVRPNAQASRFGRELRCPTSRITELPGGVRHELAVPTP